MNKKCLFIGSKSLGLHVLKTVYEINKESLSGCVTFDDSNDERSVLTDISEFCAINDIGIEIINKPSELKSVIRKIKPEFCLVSGWYWIIDENTINICSDGIIGIHASLLPRYRGFAPLVWAIINGETETGVSMFYFDSRIDEGDLIDQRRIDISYEDHICDVLLKVEKTVLKMVEENYELLLDGKANRFKQLTKNISYCAKRIPDDGKIDWNNNKEYIYNFIRAQTKPYPCAFIYDCKGEKVKVLSSKIFPYSYYGSTGLIVGVEEDCVTVCCKNGAIVIKPEVDRGEIRERFRYSCRLS